MKLAYLQCAKEKMIKKMYLLMLLKFMIVFL